MRVRVLPSAKRDMRRGIRFYQKQQEGLGAYFLDSISADIDSLQLLAGVHPMRRDHHRFLAERFPFWIYYRIDGEIAYVVAILDARQNPEKILQREKIEQARSANPPSSDR